MGFVRTLYIKSEQTSNTCVERSGKEFKAHVYKRRERERVDRQVTRARSAVALDKQLHKYLLAANAEYKCSFTRLCSRHPACLCFDKK